MLTYEHTGAHACTHTHTYAPCIYWQKENNFGLDLGHLQSHSCAGPEIVHLMMDIDPTLLCPGPCEPGQGCSQLPEMTRSTGSIQAKLKQALSPSAAAKEASEGCSRGQSGACLPGGQCLSLNAMHLGRSCLNHTPPFSHSLTASSLEFPHCSLREVL